MRNKNTVPQRFDKEGFFLAGGIGIVCSALGVLLIWAVKTAPEGASSSSGFTTAQRIARLLPISVKEKLALLMGGLFLLFGILCIFMGLKIVVEYFVQQAKK